MLFKTEILSYAFIPSIITIIIVYGAVKKIPVYDAFIAGAKEGSKAAYEMLPFIIAIFIGIEALTSSGAMDFIEKLLSPLLNLLHVPEELTSLILLRPVSGSGSLVLVEKVMEECGPDSFIGRSACVMAGSCETVVYVLALYFGVTHVKKMRHTLLAGIIGYIVGVATSLLFCSIL